MNSHANWSYVTLIQSLWLNANISQEYLRLCTPPPPEGAAGHESESGNPKKSKQIFIVDLHVNAKF